LKIQQFLFIATMAFALSACSDSGDKAAQTATETPSETPQEQTQSNDANESTDNQASEEKSKDDSSVVDQVKTPIDKAKAVEGVLQDAAEEQRQEIDKATEE